VSSLPFAASLNVSKESIALGWCVCAWIHRGGGMERCGELNGFGRLPAFVCRGFILGRRGVPCGTRGARVWEEEEAAGDAVRVYGAYLPVLVILPVLLRRPRSCVFVRGLLALRDERAAAERHGRDSARGRRIRPRWVGRWVTCEASAWPHARALAGLKTRLLRGTDRGPRRGSMDPRSVRSFASVRGSPSVEVAFYSPTEINE
jgi:hypothetical protein